MEDRCDQSHELSPPEPITSASECHSCKAKFGFFSKLTRGRVNCLLCGKVFCKHCTRIAWLQQENSNAWKQGLLCHACFFSSLRGILGLPPEVQCMIFSYLDYRSIATCERVCKYWRDILQDEAFVRQIFASAGVLYCAGTAAVARNKWKAYLKAVAKVRSSSRSNTALKMRELQLAAWPSLNLMFPHIPAIGCYGSEFLVAITSSIPPTSRLALFELPAIKLLHTFDATKYLHASAHGNTSPLFCLKLNQSAFFAGHRRKGIHILPRTNPFGPSAHLIDIPAVQRFAVDSTQVVSMATASGEETTSFILRAHMQDTACESVAVDLSKCFAASLPAAKPRQTKYNHCEELQSTVGATIRLQLIDNHTVLLSCGRVLFRVDLRAAHEPPAALWSVPLTEASTITHLTVAIGGPLPGNRVHFITSGRQGALMEFDMRAGKADTIECITAWEKAEEGLYSDDSRIALLSDSPGHQLMYRSGEKWLCSTGNVATDYSHVVGSQVALAAVVVESALSISTVRFFL